eukprot:3650972-Prymnesium_polylepis.1
MLSAAATVLVFTRVGLARSGTPNCWAVTVAVMPCTLTAPSCRGARRSESDWLAVGAANGWRILNVAGVTSRARWRILRPPVRGSHRDFQRAVDSANAQERETRTEEGLAAVGDAGCCGCGCVKNPSGTSSGALGRWDLRLRAPRVHRDAQRCGRTLL